MNGILEFGYTYQGITFDERLALRHLFCGDDDTYDRDEQPSGGSAPEGTRQ